MQTVCRGLRGVECSTRSLRSARYVSPRQVQWHSRSMMDWLRKRVAADVRKPERDPASAKKAPLLSPSDGTEAGEDITAEPTERKHPKKKHTEHKYSTSNFKISHRKLNMLGRQIAGKPIDHAVLQMMFSEKRASKRLKSMLVLAKEHAIRYKELDLSRLIVSEAWVTKGPSLRHNRRLEPRGRGHFGVRIHPSSRLHVVLREGKTFEEKQQELRRKQLKRIVSAGLSREDIPIRNPAPYWGW